MGLHPFRQHPATVERLTRLLKELKAKGRSVPAAAPSSTTTTASPPLDAKTTAIPLDQAVPISLAYRLHHSVVVDSVPWAIATLDDELSAR